MVVPEPNQHWGIFGGVFDPVHRGHIQLAEDIAPQAALDGVLFVPSWRPPHRQIIPQADYAHRLCMLELALESHPTFSLSTIERDMPEPGYTLNVVRQLKQRHPHVSFDFILGADNLASFKTWYRWDELLAEIHILAGARPGHAASPTSDLPDRAVTFVSTGTWDVSSTRIRELIASGTRPEKLTSLLPDGVAAYISEHGLYV